MREIKFRAWDKKVKDNPGIYKDINPMYYDVQDTYDNCLGDRLPGERSFGSVINNPRYILMQYTGLKDKNGKEIYEGDILLNEPPFRDNEMCLVKYKGSGFWAYEPDIDDFNGDIEHWITDNTKIIGNIYENPELLGSKEG